MTRAAFLNHAFGGLAALALAVASAVAGFGFSYNGSQYASWVVVLLGIALALFVATVLFFMGRK